VRPFLFHKNVILYAPMTDNNETTVESRVYEVSFVFDNKLDETAALEKGNALKQSIATLGGSFISEETPYLRELAYEMIRVQNNVNVRFTEGYFGWIKFEMDPSGVKQIEKNLREDEQVVRFIVVKTVSENTVFTKRAPVIKAETLANEINIDTTLDETPKEEAVLVENTLKVEEEKVVAPEEKKEEETSSEVK